MRRTAVFFCLGIVIVAAVLPCAIVFTPLCFGDALAAVDAKSIRSAIECDGDCSPLLILLTPRHLARASLRSFAA